MISRFGLLGFTTAWEQRKLGEVLTEIKRPIKMDDSKEYELVTVKRRNEGIVSRGLFKGKDILVKNYYELKAGDYVISKRQVVHGANGQVPLDLDGAIVSNEYLVSIGNKNITTSFLTILSRLPSMYKMFFLSSYGIDIEKLVFDVDDWKRREVLIPPLLEQNQISDFFRTLDELIAKQKRKCDGLKDLKKAYLQQMFPSDGEDVPRVRFDGFHGKWERRQFDEVYSHLQNNTLSRAELNYESGQTINIHYGDILVKYGECLDILSQKMPLISDEVLVRKYDKSFVQNGDVIMADTAEDSTVGKCCEIVGLHSKKVLSGLHTIPCRPNWKFGRGYLGYYMNSPAYHNQLRPLMQGIKVTSISKSALQTTHIVYPQEAKEQEAVGTFFLNLDTQIATAQNRVTQLQQLTSAYLQKMFI